MAPVTPRHQIALTVKRRGHKIRPHCGDKAQGQIDAAAAEVPQVQSSTTLPDWPDRIV